MIDKVLKCEYVGQYDLDAARNEIDGATRHVFYSGSQLMILVRVR